jgi:crotonobetainyl-CoA:carnitine CoA-transferase CaiB-like acyl-CoA transferase
MGKLPWRIQRRAPLIGEHNEEIYLGELGFSKEQLTAYRTRGII